MFYLLSIYTTLCQISNYDFLLSITQLKACSHKLRKGKCVHNLLRFVDNCHHELKEYIVYIAAFSFYI